MFKPKENGDVSHLLEHDTGFRYALLLLRPRPRCKASTVKSICRAFSSISSDIAWEIVDAASAHGRALITVLHDKVRHISLR